MIDRLQSIMKEVDAMAEFVQLIDLTDPVGNYRVKRPNGLEYLQNQAPIGVIGITYESRPNVTIDCAGLCPKSGNASILRGGKKLSTLTVLAKIISTVLKDSPHLTMRFN